MNSESANTQGTVPQGKALSCRNGAGGGIHVDVFDNFDELAPMQQEWDNFVESVGAEIFLTYDWCRVWWNYYGKNRSLKVFVFRQEGTLVGIIPLFFEKIWLGPVFVRVGKIVSSDFTPVTVSVPVQQGCSSEVLRAFLTLLREYRWDLIVFGPLAGMFNNYDILKQVCTKLMGDSFSIQAKNSGVHIYVELSESWDNQLNSLNSKTQRRIIRQSCREISRAENYKRLPLVRNLAAGDNFEEIFDGFVRMHQIHWQKLGKLGHFADWRNAIQFHRQVAIAQMQHNRLRLLEVKLGDSPLGYQYDYKFGCRYHAFLNARGAVDELPGVSPTVSIGSILYAEQVKNAIKEGVRCIDMMQGRDEYKLRLGGKIFPVRTIYIFPKKLFVLIRVYLFRALSWLLNFCYYRIWFCRIAPKLPFKRRPLWQIWIRTRAFG